MSQRFVYVISDGEYLKVGLSAEPHRRLRDLQTSNARTLLLAHLHATTAARRMEALVHNLLAQYAVRGEWFNCDLETVLDAIREAERVRPRGQAASKAKAWRVRG